VLIGGYTLLSDPVTLCPSSLAIAAIPPIKLPQIPKICRCIDYFSKFLKNDRLPEQRSLTQSTM
jgi:hypothetical protein